MTTRSYLNVKCEQTEISYQDTAVPVYEVML
jgi:hypothetical protein